jgi:UTP--glucose-1-phosphate uridylyltransferase
VGDHLYLSRGSKSCAQQLVETASAESCSVSAVQSTHESKLPNYGAVGGRLVSGRPRLYQVDTVIEKPTPTEAEQSLVVPGLRAGYYLCHFGMQVLTPAFFGLLGGLIESSPAPFKREFSQVLLELSQKERFLALELQGRRFDIGVKYGLLTAQLAFALASRDRDEVLTGLVELLAPREG